MSFSYASADYCLSVLTTEIASQLISLKIESCSFTNAQLYQILLPCTRLEELVIKSTFYDKSLAMTTAPTVDTGFLPNLKTLDVSCCLGQCARIFEGMEGRALTTLRLYCSHLGVEGASDYQWSDVSKFYPNLREMELNYAQGLTGMMYRDLILSLKKIEKLSIPRPEVFLQFTENERLQNVFSLMNAVDCQRPGSKKLSLEFVRSNGYHCSFNLST